MSGWIKLEKSLEDDPRVLRMIAQLRNADVTHDRYNSNASVTLVKRAPLLVFGALVRLWWYADTHIREDNRIDLGATEIDELVGLDGFCEMMPQDWLREIDDKTVELPDFQEHNGVEAKKRAVTQKRVQRHRNAHSVTSCNADVTHDALPDQTRPDHKETTTAESEKISLSTEGAWINLKDSKIEVWKKAYPAVLLDAELAAAAAWILANPKNKKTNYARFLTNWLKRQQDRAPRVYAKQQPQGPIL
ncbi:MAG: hypothetical protein V1784_04915 [bacterium]